MTKYPENILLSVWRIASEHADIGSSTSAIASLLIEKLPAEQFLVCEINSSQNHLEIITEGLPGRKRTLTGSKIDCSKNEIQKLQKWHTQGNILICNTHTPPLPKAFMETITRKNTTCDIMAGPIGGPDNLNGILIFTSKPNCRFDANHQAFFKTLLEPFSVVLQNDRRLRELSTFRKAAEADKQSLLAKLGRDRLTDEIVGVDSGLHEVMERIKLVARSNAPVLIFGETGSGKELIARVIHTRSQRANGAFIRVNCGAIPPELIDSQLFGHERGAFTGAVKHHKGWFERADGGTLLLDEIAELPPAAQVRLLRILQDGWLERVGGHEPIRVDVRIIAATHRDLAAMVADGKFREDLWYRIAVFPIVLPPLRQRRKDIPELACHFAKRAAIRFGLTPVMPAKEALSLLSSYDWPGNVRELASVMDRAAILGNGVSLEIAKALGVTPQVSGAGAQYGRSDSKSSNVPVPLEEAIRRHIETALTITGGQVEGARGAASLLKINPNTLRAKMRKMGINRRKFKNTDPAA